MAATTPSGRAQELTEGKGQGFNISKENDLFYHMLMVLKAFQALINSISPDNSHPAGTPNNKITPEQLRSITEKLGEIVGNNGNEGLRNDKGEVCPYFFECFRAEY
jgi:hypothetical protein